MAISAGPIMISLLVEQEYTEGLKYASMSKCLTSVEIITWTSTVEHMEGKQTPVAGETDNPPSNGVLICFCLIRKFETI